MVGCYQVRSYIKELFDKPFQEDEDEEREHGTWSEIDRVTRRRLLSESIMMSRGLSRKSIKVNFLRL